MKFLRIILLMLLTFFGSSLAKYVAILETISYPDAPVTQTEKLFITDELRSDALVILKDHDYDLMSSENIREMLPPGKTIEDCEGECLVETGRNIAADYVVQGRVGRFADELTLTVELYETATAKFLGSITCKHEIIQGLRLEMKAKTQELFSKLLPKEEPKKEASADSTSEKDINLKDVDYSYDDDDDVVITYVDEHIVPRWVTWTALTLGVAATWLGFMNNLDMENARNEYDDMGAGYSIEAFNDKWRDVEYCEKGRNILYGIGIPLLVTSIILFIFD